MDLQGEGGDEGQEGSGTLQTENPVVLYGFTGAVQRWGGEGSLLALLKDMPK